MPDSVSRSTRGHIAQSLPLLERHREALAAAFEASLRSAERGEDGFGPPAPTAALLLDLLIAQGRRLAEGGAPAGLDAARRDLAAAGIDGRHYSRFGDALIPVLRDVLGPSLPREIASGWCDAFWAAVRALQPVPVAA